MRVSERAFLFTCADDELVGILSMPAKTSVSTGVLIVVGGPQYRIGSHRSFVILARRLAAMGIPCMRFDYRGMGDATGTERTYDTVEQDIRAAVDALFRQISGLQRVVLWGLCDGATASCLYAPEDDRVSGVVLVNPWVRTAVSEAKTMVKHYYASKLVDPLFWRRLVSGKVAFGASARDVIRALRLSRRPNSGPGAHHTALAAGMADTLIRGRRRFALVLSGRDYVAREFEELALSLPEWTAACRTLLLSRSRIEDANHTFARAEWRLRVAQLTAETVRLIEQSIENGTELAAAPKHARPG